MDSSPAKKQHSSLVDIGIGIDHAAHFALLLIRLDGMASSNQRIKIRRKKERKKCHFDSFTLKLKPTRAVCSVSIVSEWRKIGDRKREKCFKLAQ
jgi:hypothetical protein